MKSVYSIWLIAQLFFEIGKDPLTLALEIVGVIGAVLFCVFASRKTILIAEGVLFGLALLSTAVSLAIYSEIALLLTFLLLSLFLGATAIFAMYGIFCGIAGIVSNISGKRKLTETTK